MMRFILKERFEGINEDGLTFDEVIAKDVKDHIDSFFYFQKNIIDENDNIDISNIGNARFVISRYYYKYLDEYVPGELAKELKKKIEDSIGADHLLTIPELKTE